MNQERPRLLASTESSRGDESNFTDESMGEDLMETVPALQISNETWNEEYSDNAILHNDSRELFTRQVQNNLNESVLEENTIISDLEYDQSLSSWVVSVSPSDEDAFQDQGGYSDDESYERTCNFGKYMMEDEELSQPKDLPTQCSCDESMDDQSSNLNSKENFDTASDLNGSDSTNLKNLEISEALSIELKTKIEGQKAKLQEDFLNWKTDIPQHFGNHLGLLTEVFKVRLHSLDKGDYWFGPDFIVNCNERQAPDDAVFVGVITSEGSEGKKYLLRNGRKRVELTIGYSETFANFLTIKVDSDGFVALYNKAKPSYQMVCAGPPDLLFDYNPKMVFVGIITSDLKFKVKILGQDEVHDIDLFPGGCQVMYSDRLSKLQTIYPLRNVVLNVVSEKVAIIDFNYSYACYLAEKYPYVPKFVDLYIPAGTNPLYF